MSSFNIYLTGVGGQGIGLISEVILRAVDDAGQNVKSVDTHGLAQRGGVVVSQIRMGEKVYSPLIPPESADLVVALERHEALRGMNTALKDGGTLVYYNTVQQPLETRLNQAGEVSEQLISETCEKRNITEYYISDDNLEDPRMQNIALLAAINKNSLIPNVEEKHYLNAMEDLLAGQLLEKNREVFKRLSG